MTRRTRWSLVLAMATAVTLSQGAAAQVAMPEDEQQELKNAERARTAEARLEQQVVQAGPVDPATYVLGPGDVLELDLWGRVARTVPLDVSPEGGVFVPGRGSLDVGGKTLERARERILKMVAEQYVGVRADVRLVQLRKFKVYLTGDVKNSGAVEATSATRAHEAISQVGLLDGASRRNISVQHADGSTVRIDLDQFERIGRQNTNPLLVDGDVLLVPHATKFMDISGAVARSMRFELAPGDSLSTLIALAGGLLPSASPDHALLVRFTSPTDRESLLVNLQDPAATAAPMLDGDRLFVKFQPEYHRLMTISVVGEIERPGNYPIVPGRDRLTDLIRAAGGFRPQANREAVHLVRESAAEKDPDFDRLVRLGRNDMTESEYIKLETMLAERKNSFRVDWTRLRAGGPTDPLLQDEDVIRVDRFVPSVRIEGQVKRPGFVDYAPGRGLGDYIQMAGGFTERSARHSIRVSRSLTGQIIPARSLRSVQPGDFIWVPERRDIDAWIAFRDIVAVSGQLAVVIFTLSRR